MNEEHNNTAAAVAAGENAQTLEKRYQEFGGASDDDRIPFVLLGHGQKVEVLHELMDLEDERAPTPRRRKGTAKHDELGSFCDHVNRFKSKDSTIWADVGQMRMTAILDYHPADDAAWCQHRSVYTCPVSAAWQEWCNVDGGSMTQDALADFLEERLEDLVTGKKGDFYPQPMAVLEMARSLQVHTKGRFERKVHPTTGDYSLVCKQETESSSTPIPRAFLIGIPIFEGGELYRIEVRLRLQVRDGVAKFRLQLHRRAELIASAFQDIRDQAGELTEIPVFAGTPE